MKFRFAALSIASTIIAIAITSGCASRETPSAPEPSLVPTYRSQPPPNMPPPVPPLNPASANAATSAPAPGQSEAFPSSPGPEYVWMPSYWTTSVRGDWVWIGGHYVARQGVADEQLRAARGMLEQARGNLDGKPLKKVNNAIDQINDALQVR